jgi:hypothetical protein
MHCWKFRWGIGSSDEKDISNPRTLDRKNEESSDGGRRKFRHWVVSSDENKTSLPRTLCLDNPDTSDGCRKFRPGVGSFDIYFSAP